MTYLITSHLFSYNRHLNMNRIFDLEYWIYFSFRKIEKNSSIITSMIKEIIEMDEFKQSGFTEEHLREGIEKKITMMMGKDISSKNAKEDRHNEASLYKKNLLEQNAKLSQQTAIAKLEELRKKHGAVDNNHLSKILINKVLEAQKKSEEGYKKLQSKT